MKSLESKFIVFEGTDGVGKTTQVDLLERQLEYEGYNTLRISTPGERYRNDELVQRYNQAGEGPLTPTTLAVMAAADRLRTADAYIKPHLDNGGVVVCDRYYYSAAAYFSMRGADMETVDRLHSHLPEPDYAILLSIDSLTRAARLRQRATTQDWEEQNMPYLDEVQNRIWQRWRQDFLVVDARNSIENIYYTINNYLEGGVS